MKTNILYLFVLIINFSFAQQENLLKNSFFKINVEENHYATDQIFSSVFYEIKELENIKPSNNSEGKFPLYTINKNTSKTTLSSDKASFLLIKEYVKFVNNIIQKKSADIHKNDLITLELISNNLENNYTYTVPQIIDVLNANFKIGEKVEVQFGKNLEPYLMKINKSALDKTLQNSLNLLVVNF